MSERVGKLQATIDRLGWGGVFLAPGDDLRYFAGFSTHADERPAFLAVTPGGVAWLMPSVNAEQTRAHTEFPVFSYGDDEGPGSAVRQLWGDLGLAEDTSARFGVNEDMRGAFLLLLQGALPRASWMGASDATAAIRMVKDADEIARLQHVATCTDRVVEAGWRAVREGRSEIELERIVKEAFAAEGSDEVLFSIVGSGPNSAFPHHETGDRKVQAGEPVLFDIGCRINGYCSDITRMAYLGEPTDEYRKVHAAVDAAVEAAFLAAQVGAPLGAVDRAARSAIAEAGYGEYFVHRVGHGLGMSGHELPSVHGRNETQIEEGMVFTIEPGIYLPGKFGVRLEEVCVVQGGSGQRLSRLTRDVYVAGAGAQ